MQTRNAVQATKWLDMDAAVVHCTEGIGIWQWDMDYDSLFTKDKHIIIFGFHGYPWLVHRLTYRRTNRNIHVRGYKE